MSTNRKWTRTLGRPASLVVGALVVAAVVAASALAGTIVGTARSDTIRGTGGADKLYGRGGNDALFGMAGEGLPERRPREGSVLLRRGPRQGGRGTGRERQPRLRGRPALGRHDPASASASASASSA